MKTNRQNLQMKNQCLFVDIIKLFPILLAYSMNTLPMGTAYAVWTGIGASGGAIVGMVLFGESKDWKKIIFIAMVLESVIGLKLTL
ncbi:DMT family transporter [Pseudogracilibacillus sp. SO30301A]|uniref:DMT family transporter n=1 Tax=Pseudogracilibacillus sp. SO30301A TaxID=3098291 RepID=UPI00300E0100